ncbi:hypothetical protein SeLEV6574_g08070 [Synchytrium endobioticum]|uniref:Peptidase A2 domain-containing protein n=1 Tax=Synchytrium endobioticum TaxID=286115 RepID=A0A507CAM2_9FUNG|nr:hypothetical protein SeLEV6574_g08070 [Synchytrium endobioticum]
MVKSINIILVIILTALITTIGAAPEWDDDAIMNVARKMIKCAAGVVNKRTAALGNPFLGCMHDWSDQTYIGAQIAGIVSKSIPPFSPFQNQQLFQEPIESMRTSQVHFTRAYHSLVFEKLKTLFMKIELCIAELLNSEKKLNRVATYLLMHHDLEERCRQLLRRRSENCSKWRELELPHYDWGHVRTVLLPTLLNQLAQSQSPICNDVTPAGMLECFQMRVQNVIEGRKEEVRRGLPFNLRAVLDPTSYVATLIAQIRSDSRPFAFTEEQLLEEPKASMLQDQLHLTRVYHRLVVETLKTLVIMIKNNLRAHEHKVKLEQALAEVECAQRMHQNLESAYKQIHQKTHNRSIGRRRKLKLPVNGLAPLDSTQSTREAQNYAYNDQPVFNHGPGSGLEASTGQPGPWMVERVTREDSVAKQPQRVGIHDDPKQQVLIDFPGVADMTWKAAPGNHGHSHDDRDALTDDRYSSELHRPPSGHVGFVGESSMLPGPSADNIRRAGDSSLHGLTTTSNTRVAGSPQKIGNADNYKVWLSIKEKYDNEGKLSKKVNIRSIAKKDRSESEEEGGINSIDESDKEPLYEVESEDEFANIDTTTAYIARISATERKYPPKFLIDAVLKHPDTGKSLEAKALLDSGASRNGQPTAPVTHQTKELSMVIQNHQEEITLPLFKTKEYDIILGLDWLTYHNPSVDWELRTIVFDGYGCKHPLKQHRMSQTSQNVIAFTREEILQEIPIEPLKVPEISREVLCQIPDVLWPMCEFPSIFDMSKQAHLPDYREGWDFDVSFKPETPLPKPRPLFRLPMAQRKLTKDYIKAELESGKIRSSMSPIAANLFFVTKNDSEELRPTVDYRDLNSSTIDDRYPLPVLKELIQKLAGGKWYSKFDLRWGIIIYE